MIRGHLSISLILTLVQSVLNVEKSNISVLLVDAGNNRDAVSRRRVWHYLRAVLGSTSDDHQRYWTATRL